MNILILAAGTRNKIIEYFKKDLGNDGEVIAADASLLAPAIYVADKYYIVPRCCEPGYIDCILDICRKEHVAGVLSLIDTDLSILAQNADRFREIGTTVIGSPYEASERAFNKMKMFHWLREHGYHCADSWTDRDEFFRAVENGKVSYPVFVKPAKGSASRDIARAVDAKMVDFFFEYGNEMMVQEFLNGQELGADVYIDMLSGEVASIFTKKKLRMRAGETDKAVSFKDPKLFAFIEKFVKEAGFRGQIDIDIFDIGGTFYISEVNPRFGGGYPHAYCSGCDHMRLILNNLQGITNEKHIGDYEEGTYMMKYCEIKIMKQSQE